jgi:diacylglycerol kinase (ATP)
MTERAGTPAAADAPAPDARPERWTAVLNPAAGRRGARTRVSEMEVALGASALDVDVHVTTSAADLADAATRAFDDGRGVIAGGGDGTVSIVAGVAVARDGVLGILAAGSGNDLARQLGLPRGDVRAAVRVLEHGTVTRVDLGRAEVADGTHAWFTTVANSGFDAEANRWANSQHWLTGTPLYVLAVLRTLRTYHPRPVRITVDSAVIETDAWLVAVANTRSYAGGMVIAPAASIGDGLLDVCVVGPVSRVEFLRTFPKVFRGTHVRHPLVTTVRGADIRIEGLSTPNAHDESAPELWASGERVGPLPARITATRGALRVIT